MLLPLHRCELLLIVRSARNPLDLPLTNTGLNFQIFRIFGLRRAAVGFIFEFFDLRPSTAGRGIYFRVLRSSALEVFFCLDFRFAAGRRNSIGLGRAP